MKELQAVLYTPKMKQMKLQIKAPKIPYTNWFFPSLWLLICAAITTNLYLTKSGQNEEF
jgi:hypothetical protein